MRLDLQLEGRWKQEEGESCSAHPGASLEHLVAHHIPILRRLTSPPVHPCISPGRVAVHGVGCSGYATDCSTSIRCSLNHNQAVAPSSLTKSLIV